VASPLAVPDIAALHALVGQDLGVSDWVLVSQERIDEFADATGDDQWIHVDVERAKHESPFGGTVAHGYLTLALAPALLPQLLVVEKCSRVVNYGIDKLRLREPVLAGTQVRLGGEIKNVRKVANDAVLVTHALRWEAERVARAVCRADVVYVYYS
jgi:acyl dehydratase